MGQVMGGEGVIFLKLESLGDALQRRVQCHGRTPWWKGMGNPEECPQEWGHGSLKGYATVLRRRINQLRRGSRRDGCPLGRFRRPRRLRFPNKGFIVHLWPVRIAVAVTLLESSDLQSLEVFYGARRE